jgi:hypothetical protein
MLMACTSAAYACMEELSRTCMHSSRPLVDPDNITTECKLSFNFQGFREAKSSLYCSVRRSVTAQQAGLDPEDDTERTVNMVTRHGMKP